MRHRIATGLVLLGLLGCQPGPGLDEARARQPETTSAPAATEASLAPAPPATRWRKVESSAERVLFLPVANRTVWRIHPRYLRAIDETLAVHAALFLGREVVSSEVAGALAAELGRPLGFASESAWRPDEAALSGVARRTGAGLVVWGAIEADGTLALSVHAGRREASGAPWDGLRVPLDGEPDRALYEAPERVLRALAARAPEAALGRTQEAPPAEAMAALERALAEFGEGSTAAMRRAEVALAEIAARHPHWAKPWAWLAFVRMARPFALEGWDAAILMAEGTAAARHVARLLPLDPDDRARLDLVDRYFLDAVLPWPETERITSALPADEWSRALAAYVEGTRARAVFRLDDLAPRTRLGRSLLALGRARPVERGDVAIAVAGERDPEQLLGDAVLLRALENDARRRGEWSDEYFWVRATAPALAIEVLETLRLACGALERTQARACRAPLRDWLSRRGVTAPAESAGLAALASELEASRALLAPPELTAPPAFAVLGEDETFAGLWHLASELIELADATFARIDASGRPVVPPGELLIVPARERVHRIVDQLVEAAFQPAYIGRRRGQRDEADPYLEALAGLSQRFPLSHFRYLQSRATLDHEKIPLETLEVFVRLDPYEIWAWDWERALEGKAANGAAVRELERLRPQLTQSQRLVGRAWARVDDPQARKAWLLSTLRHRPKATLAQDLDGVLHDLHEPRAERLALLETALRAYPLDVSLSFLVAALYLEDGQLERAEGLFSALLESNDHHEQSCRHLAAIHSMRKQQDRAREQLRSCAAAKDHRWASARLWVSVGNHDVVHDRFEEAIASYQEARKQVGDAAWVLEPLARALEFAGRHEEAYALYEREHRTYESKTMSDGRYHQVALQIRRGELDQAGKLLPDPLEPHDDNGWAALRIVRRAEGRLDAFAREARDRQSVSSLWALIWSDWYDRKDVDSALAGLDELVRLQPENEDLGFRRGELLLEAGRLEEALPHLRAAFERQPFNSVRRLYLVRVLCGSGRVDEAEPLVRDYLARYPNESFGDEMRAHVLLARGDTAGARDALVAADWYDPRHDNENWHFDGVGRRLRQEMALGLYPTAAQDRARLVSRMRSLSLRASYAKIFVDLAELLASDGDARGARNAETLARRFQADPPWSRPAAPHR